ncbi:MAG: tetratricopeptide repeat protein, partial [Acidimicrobiia bacterium]
SYLRELHGDLTGAEQAMVQALTAGSRSPFDRAITTALLGDLYLKRGDLNRAEESYLEAERLIPGLLGARIGRARVLTAAGDLEAAAEVLEQVVARFPEPGALTQLGEVLTQLGRPDEARNAFDTVAVITDLQTEAGAIVDLELARFAANHGDPKAARVLAAEAYRNRPTVFAAQVLAWAMHRSGDSASALPLAEEALRLGTANASLHLQAAEILGANGQATRARQLRSAARQWDPWFHVLHPELAR